MNGRLLSTNDLGELYEPLEAYVTSLTLGRGFLKKKAILVWFVRTGPEKKIAFCLLPLH